MKQSSPQVFSDSVKVRFGRDLKSLSHPLFVEIDRDGEEKQTVRLTKDEGIHLAKAWSLK